MSPRAACRLEALGYDQVFDYAAGIADWKAAGLPVDGAEDPGLLVREAVRTDVPTALPGDRVGDVRQRAMAAGWGEAVVLDCERVVVGRLRAAALAREPSGSVDAVMEAGPTTVRPDESLHALVERMERRGTTLVVVTDPQGRLIGVVRSEEAGRLTAGEPAEQIWHDCEGCPGRKSTQAPGT